MKQMPNDGLIHRFIPVIMSPAKLNVRGDSRVVQTQWNDWLRFFHHSIKPGIAQMSAEARKVFEEEDHYVRSLVSPTYEFAPSLASALAKHSGMLARVALTFHCFTGSDYATTEISVHSMWKAVTFMRKVRRHDASMFNDILGSSEALSLAQALGRSIVADGPFLTTVGRQWMSDHCADWKKADERIRREAIQVLEDADWLEVSAAAKSYGGWPTKWAVHDRLSLIFSAEGEEWRKRRAAVREAIGQPD